MVGKFIVALLAFTLIPALARADADPFDRCQTSKSHEVCFAAMSTYEERMNHASDLAEFCALASRYVGLQGYDSFLSGNPFERKNAYETSKMLADKCGPPYRSILLKMHSNLAG